MRNRLAKLATDYNVLIVGSGNVVHNLSMVQWHAGNVGFDWADDFDNTAIDAILNDPDCLETLAEHSAFNLAMPTPDHFLPLAYIAGVSAGLGKTDITVFNDERTMGSLSMTGFAVTAQACHRPGLSPPRPVLSVEFFVQNIPRQDTLVLEGDPLLATWENAKGSPFRTIGAAPVTAQVASPDMTKG
ncbi:MAG: hypothetical protein SPI77_00820 [Corynebacterium sp.]|nr:hypothetical protein [Corynebacterium sp.]